MSFLQNYRTRVLGVMALGVMGASVEAQTVPWISFTDGITGQTCEVVQTDGLDLVVSQNPLTGRVNFVVVTGGDVRLDDTEVLENNDVLYLGQPTGFIAFDEDRVGNVGLWWVALGNSVLSVDRLTGEPSATNAVPGDFVVSTCDACDVWDDPNACPAVIDPDLPPLNFNFCGVNTALAATMTIVGLVGTRVSRRRVRR